MYQEIIHTLTMYGGNAVITHYTGNAVNLMVPSILDGKTVTEIDSDAFYHCDSIISVTLPDTMISIKFHSFYNCLSLTSIYIPKHIENIDAVAFFGCIKLTTILVSPDNSHYFSIDGVLFEREDISLIAYPLGKTASEYIVPDGTVSINAFAFWGCTSLSSITLPDSVLWIADHAFAYCTVTSVILPRGLEVIEKYAFYCCFSLSSINLPESLLIIESYAFYACVSLPSVTLHDNLVMIGDFAFYGCKSLTSFSIPASVANIYDGILANCTSLVSITVSNDNPIFAVIDSALYDMKEMELIAYPAMNLDVECCIPNGVLTIRRSAFACCTSLISVTLPASLLSIDAEAFFTAYRQLPFPFPPICNP